MYHLKPRQLEYSKRSFNIFFVYIKNDFYFLFFQSHCNVLFLSLIFFSWLDEIDRCYTIPNVYCSASIVIHFEHPFILYSTVIAFWSSKRLFHKGGN